MGKLISVIIPVYNGEKYIERCVKSILNQKYSHLEIIIVNDGSTDKTHSICLSLMEIDERIKYFRQSNFGVSSARNKGLSLANGDYISFIDSDDYIEESMYEKMVIEIKNDVDIVECGFKKVDLNHNIIKKSNYFREVLNDSYNITKKYLLHQNTSNYTCTKLFKADLFSNIEFPNFTYSEDYFVNVLTSINANKKVIIPDREYNYFIHDENATSKPISIKSFDTIKSGISLKRVLLENYPDLSVYNIVYILDNLKNLQISPKPQYYTNKIYNMNQNIYNKLYDTWSKEIKHSDLSQNRKKLLKLYRNFPLIYKTVQNTVILLKKRRIGK